MFLNNNSIIDRVRRPLDVQGRTIVGRQGRKMTERWMIMVNKFISQHCWQLGDGVCK